MIPKPNLDDRTHRQIVEEAMRLIPQYCPEWTNHNPNDPGVALIELFAWMMEMGLYRMNQVPEKTYLTLMELIGMRLGQAQAARVLVSFALAEGKQAAQWVPAGTPVATVQSEDADSVVFETAQSLLVSDNQLVKCFSAEQDRINDNSDILLNPKSAASFPVFQSHHPVERFVYLGDAEFGRLREADSVTLSFPSAFRGPELTPLLEWEYFNGHRWVGLEPAPKAMNAAGERNTVIFKGPLASIAPSQVNGRDSVWLRGRLALRPEHPQQTRADAVRLQVCMQEQGIPPDFCFANAQGLVYEPVDASKDFNPFSSQPRFNDAFYIAAGKVFGRPQAGVEINFTLSKNPNIPPPEGSEDLILAWEYWNGREWAVIGQSTNRPQEEPAGPYGFTDGTVALTKEGRLFFRAPEDWSACEIAQQKNYWLRIRIHTGDFGVGGTWAPNEQSQWVWKLDRPIRPPFISRISVKCHLAAHAPLYTILDDAHQLLDISGRVRENEQWLAQKRPASPMDLFPAQFEKHPGCYFGFQQAFPAEENQLYFLLKDRPCLPLAEAGMDAERVPVALVWEYWNGNEWRDLTGVDQTLGLSRSGSLSFQGPKDFQSRTLWGQRLHWIRARYESGSYEQVPYLAKVLLNTVEAFSRRSVCNEWLGSSDGAPDQRYPLAYCPVVGPAEIWVAENEHPMREDAEAILQAEGPGAIRQEADAEGKRTWVRWHAVDGFYESGPADRHYVLDANEGVVQFGDGCHGRIPPEGRNNILAARYSVGGGADSNVGINTVTVMKKALPHISRVWNPVAAEGGADPETVDEAKLRTPHLLKHRFRAVTADDCEWLAKEASNQVARTKCLPAFRQEGELTVVVVPKSQPGDQLLDRLQPSRELLRRVQTYLDERRLLTAGLQVVGFKYTDISIQAEVVLKSALHDSCNLKAAIEEKIRIFLHPLAGGPDQKGWPFGQAVSKSDLHMLLEKMAGVYYVASIQIRDEDRGVEVEKLMLPEDTFAYPVAITVIEKVKA